MKSRWLHANSLFYFLILLFASGVFSQRTSNPLGIAYVRELFIAVLCIYTFLYFFRKIKVSRTDIYVVLMVVSLPFLSSLFAFIAHGQPFYYGIIEERRILEFLVYFPLKACFQKTCNGLDDALCLLLIPGLIAIALSFMHFANILPDFRAAHDLGQAAIDELEYRATFSNGFIIISVIIALVKLKYTNGSTKMWVFVVGAAFFCIAFVSQTRQDLFVLLFVFLLYSLFGAHVKHKIFLVALGLLMVLLIVIQVNSAGAGVMEDGRINNMVSRVAQVFGDDGVEMGARGVSTVIVINEISNNSYIGMGALSLLWNDGFKSKYFDYFYLADIGIIGVYYRLGILTIIFILLISIKIFHLYKYVGGEAREVLFYLIVVVFMKAFTAGFIFYMGGFLGAMFAFATYARSVSPRNRKVLGISHKQVVSSQKVKSPVF